ncbi:MAG TPA: hypothetical protein ENN41_03330 [Sediminispirochaeta sp.]|nr:hypothetical protein [Sediminispirochaeta sp.]
MKDKIKKFFAILAVELQDMQDGMTMLIKLSEERFKRHEITGYVWTENTALLKREQGVIRMIAERVSKIDREGFDSLEDAVQEVRKIVRGLPGIPQAVPDFIEKRMEKILKYVIDDE